MFDVTDYLLYLKQKKKPHHTSVLYLVKVLLARLFSDSCRVFTIKCWYKTGQKWFGKKNRPTSKLIQIIPLMGVAQSGWLPWLHVYGRNRNGLIGPLPPHSPPHPLSLEAFYSSISLALKWNHPIPLHSHPTVTAFVLRPMQMKRVSSAEMAKQPRLMFLCGPEMWMFTVGRGLITFLQQLESIGPLMGPIKQWEKPIVTMELIVSEWTHLALCRKWNCVAYLKKSSEGKKGWENREKSNK